MKRFSCFSQSQPVSAHVIVPLPVAGLVRKQLRATVLAKIVKAFHCRSVLFWLKQNSFGTVLNVFNFSFMLTVRTVLAVKYVLSQLEKEMYVIYLFKTTICQPVVFNLLCW